MLHHMVEEETISPEDIDLFYVTDSIEDAMNHIRTNIIDKYGVISKKVPEASSILLEK